MLSAAEIRNVKFSKAMGGYKQEEVDVLLDRIEADYAQFDRLIKEYKLKVDALNKEIESLKTSQNSIQNVLVSAQKLADQIVGEAKEKSEEIVRNAEVSIHEITEREKELAATFELKAQERKSSLEKELSDMIKKAQIKADSLNAAAEDSVARQQILYDKIRLEISAFKAAVSSKYKEHLELLQNLPDNAPMDPKRIAEAVSAAVDKIPDPESYINSGKNIAEETAADSAISEPDAESGFKITEDNGFEASAEEV